MLQQQLCCCSGDHGWLGGECTVRTIYPDDDSVDVWMSRAVGPWREDARCKEDGSHCWKEIFFICVKTFVSRIIVCCFLALQKTQQPNRWWRLMMVIFKLVRFCCLVTDNCFVWMVLACPWLGWLSHNWNLFVESLLHFYDCWPCQIHLHVSHFSHMDAWPVVQHPGGKYLHFTTLSLSLFFPCSPAKLGFQASANSDEFHVSSTMQLWSAGLKYR